MSLRVIVHIGPPKTGTSAIQNWLQSNRSELLKRCGIYYPEHKIDTNGISSGNVQTVFCRDEVNNLRFSPEKLANCILEAQRAGAKTLLLSSEFFFKRLEPIFDAVPEAIALAYVRDPLETMESGYNQGVKRHFQTEPFIVPDAPRAGTLNNLDRLITQYGHERFILRPYDKKLFKNQDIISDFIDALEIKGISEPAPGVINPSYVFEALEFKRWFNQIPDSRLHHYLDRFCQQYTDGTAGFSLLSETKRARVRKSLEPSLMRFVERHQLYKGDAFIDNLKAQDTRVYRRQEISVEAYNTLFYRFLDFSEINKKWLANLLRESEDSIFNLTELYGLSQNAVESYLLKNKWRKLPGGNRLMKFINLLSK